MSRRQKADPEEKLGAEEVNMEEEEPQELPPETRRTRSGRAVRRPAALLDSMEPVRTPSRRTKRTVLQELPPAVAVVEEEREPEPEPEALPEEKTDMSAEPEPDNTASEAAGEDASQARPAAPAETAPASTESAPPKKPRLGPSAQQTPVIPLGKPKSGRVWKDRSKQRFSALVRDKPLCSSWQKKMEAKREKEQVKQFSKQLKDEKAKQKEDKRKRREDNLKRRTENERKAEIVQVIRNTAKIKRMKKKQLRKIEKRDTLALLQKTQKQKTQNIKAKGPKKNTGKELT